MPYTKTSVLRRIMPALLFFVFTSTAFGAETLTYNRVSYQVTEQQEVSNDEITVIMGVERDNLDATKLANEINLIMADANRAIKKYPTIKSSTSDYSIRPVYSRDKRLEKWRGSSSILLKSTHIKDMISLVQKLQESLLIKSTRYNVSADRREKIEAGMIDAALKKFNTRAAMVSQSMGFKKYRLVNINISNSGNNPRPVYAMATARLATADIAPPALESGQSTLKVTVSGSIEMEVSP